MRFYHVSDNPRISRFEPRLSARADLDRSKGLVWALCERTIANYLVPRDCPRVTYHAKPDSDAVDISRFFSSVARHVVAIEHGWLQRLRDATLYVYEFDPASFYLQDGGAGYYVSEQPEVPLNVTEVSDLLAELVGRGVELRAVPELHTLGDAVQASTLNWSLIRMRNAQPRDVNLLL